MYGMLQHVNMSQKDSLLKEQIWYNWNISSSPFHIVPVDCPTAALSDVSKIKKEENIQLLSKCIFIDGVCISELNYPSSTPKPKPLKSITWTNANTSVHYNHRGTSSGAPSTTEVFFSQKKNQASASKISDNSEKSNNVAAVYSETAISAHMHDQISCFAQAWYISAFVSTQHLEILDCLEMLHYFLTQYFGNTSYKAQWLLISHGKFTPRSLWQSCLQSLSTQCGINNSSITNTEMIFHTNPVLRMASE